MYCHSESEIMSVSDRNSKRNMGMRNEYAHNYPQTSKIIVKEKLPLVTNTFPDSSLHEVWANLLVLFPNLSLTKATI